MSNNEQELIEEDGIWYRMLSENEAWESRDQFRYYEFSSWMEVRRCAYSRSEVWGVRRPVYRLLGHGEKTQDRDEYRSRRGIWVAVQPQFLGETVQSDWLPCRRPIPEPDKIPECTHQSGYTETAHTDGVYAECNYCGELLYKLEDEEPEHKVVTGHKHSANKRPIPKNIVAYNTVKELRQLQSYGSLEKPVAQVGQHEGTIKIHPELRELASKEFGTDDWIAYRKPGVCGDGKVLIKAFLQRDPDYRRVAVIPSIRIERVRWNLEMDASHFMETEHPECETTKRESRLNWATDLTKKEPVLMFDDQWGGEFE